MITIATTVQPGLQVVHVHSTARRAYYSEVSTGSDVNSLAWRQEVRLGRWRGLWKQLVRGYAVTVAMASLFVPVGFR